MGSRRWHRAVAGTSLVIALALRVGSADSGAQSGKRVNDTAAAQAAFLKRIDGYITLHKKLEAMLPALPKDATPQQIDQNQRALAALVTEARKDAKPGDLFTPDIQRLIHRFMAQAFSGQRGAQARKYVHDEPHPVVPEINKRYPDTVPLATMPLRVLEWLPKLPEELEYRFVANHLILMDVHAHLILDYVLNAIPAATGTKG